MWPSTSTPSSNVSSNAPYRPFESSFEDFRPNPFPSPEPPVPPPSTLSLSPPLGGTLGSNNNWSLSPPADDKTMRPSERKPLGLMSFLRVPWLQ